MPRRQSTPRRLATAARWPLGVALTSWRYFWRTTPMHRTEVEGSLEQDGPPPLPEACDWDDVQEPRDGTGTLFHRRYSACFRDTDVSPEQLMEQLQDDPNRVSPSEFAVFEKLSGSEEGMNFGDEYVVRMAAPWDGPVRAVDVTPTSFRFATLDGHLEAGQIEFRARREGGLVHFEIESWARSADWLTDALYDHLRMSKEVQVHMWVSVIERTARMVGGRLHGGITIETRRVEGPQSPLAALRERKLTFSAEDRECATAANGWHVDDYRQPLPGEAPGEPEPDGSFAAGQRLMLNYEFADPAVIRAIYEQDAALEGRDMLLEARWHGLRFRFGVRVTSVTDETRAEDGRDVHVWGWSYSTLEGHLEMGEMYFELWKWLDTGEVEFRIHAVSQRARAHNPIIGLGFRLLGRREQVRFAQRACERMAELVAAELSGSRRNAEVPRRTQMV